MKIVVGLGNPGLRYAQTRHNISFMCLRHFARIHRIGFDNKQCLSRTGSGEVAGFEITLARPQTFMNQSGKSVNCLVQKFEASMDDLIVIHDDLNLPLGKIRMRQGGSSGGHKGIESVIGALGSDNFIRLRIGIGRPAGLSDMDKGYEDAIIDYVLSDFTAEEKKVIDPLIPRVSEALLCLLTEGLTGAMNKFN